MPGTVTVKVTQSRLILCHPMEYTVHGILQARILEWVPYPFSREIFLTQESNRGLLHCRWILYQLSYHGVGTNTFLLNAFSLPEKLSSHKSLTALAANFVVLWPGQTNMFVQPTSPPRNFQLSVDNHLVNSGDFPSVSDGKSVCLQCGRPGFDPWVAKIPWRRKWQPTPVPLPGKPHGRSSLIGYSPWGRKESDMTE